MTSEVSSLSDGDAQEQTGQDVNIRAVVRGGSSVSDVKEVEHYPEITVICKKCKSPVVVQFLSAHRNYHNALSTLGYSPKKIPQTTADLLKRRNSLVRRWKTEVAESAAASIQLQRIDEGYELLKSYLNETHNERFIGDKKVDLDCRVVGLNCSAPCISAVGICWSQNSRWKPTMEDTRVFQDYFGNDSNKCFFAIYDGHNGRFAADLTANDLHHHLLREMSQFDPSTNCTCAVNLADINDLSNYRIDRTRPIVRKDSIRHILHAESVNILQQIMHTCSDNIEKLKVEKLEAAGVRKNRDPYTESMSQAFKKAFTMMDRVLSFGVQEQSRVRWSGCSALACVIKNAAVAEDLEGRMEPENHQEEGKMKDAKEGEGNVKEEMQEGTKDELLRDLGAIYIANAGNVHAVLSRGGQVHQLSRDHSPANNTEKQRLLKAGVAIHQGGAKGRVNGILDATRGLGNHGDPLLKSAILCEPYTMSIKIDQYAEFLILATDGLWEVLTNEEAAEITRQSIDIELHSSNASDKTGVQGHDCDTRIEECGTLTELEARELEDGIGSKEEQSCTSDGENQHAHEDDKEAECEEQTMDVADENDITENQSTVSNRDDHLTVNLQELDDDDDTMSMRTDYESMISTLIEGDEANIETVTEMHTIYAMGKLAEKPSEEERVRSLAERVSQRLVQAALLAGARENITVMVILLPGYQV